MHEERLFFRLVSNILLFRSCISKDVILFALTIDRKALFDNDPINPLLDKEPINVSEALLFVFVCCKRRHRLLAVRSMSLLSFSKDITSVSPRKIVFVFFFRLVELGAIGFNSKRL